MHYSENNLKITINNLTFSYLDEGSTNAPAIILIHGFPLNKAIWKKQVEILMDSYREIAYDIRGHGNTAVSYTHLTLPTSDLV